ncbi:MAG: insulinase family protein [Tannerellaceae bacterium]|nr:insulinase family protein [Tannerellaceae bacterium]
MIKRHLYPFFLLCCLMASTQLITAQQEATPPLPIDPQVRYGQLPNGLTYYIRHNELPKERADFYIAQNVGSMQEEENQRGLAHFLEHMAFNGTTHFPGNSIDRFTESIGMRGGENLNAYTSFDETVYMIMNAPVTREGIIDSCLLILHDWSGFLTLADSAIEKERGVIREEWRTRQDAQARLWEQQLPKMFPGSRYAHRLPIGTIDVIDHFKPEELRAYYRKWYRPDLQAIIIVGDIDADAVEEKVKAMFTGIPAPVDPAPRIDFPVPDNCEPLVSIATDKESSNMILSIFYKHDKLPRELFASPVGMVMDYMQSVSSTMMNERLSELLLDANPPFIFAHTSDGNFMVSKTKEAWTTAALVMDEEIETAMTALVTETERVCRFGFTAGEYERARINILKEYESLYNEQDQQRNSSYTEEYVNHFTDGGYIPGIAMEYELINQIAPAITVEQVNEYIRDIIGDENIVIGLTGPEKEGLSYPTEEELLASFLRARELPVTPYEEFLPDEPLLNELPTPGRIVSNEVEPLFGNTVLTLSNGVRVILKHTEFKNDEILMTATSPGGTTVFGDKDIKNLKIFNDAITLGGVGNFSSIDLGKILAGKKVACSPSVGLDNESMNGYATPADLQTLFELVYLYFTNNRTDEEAFLSFENRLIAQLQNLSLNPMVAFSDSINQALYNGNERALRLQIADFDEISYPHIMEMYRERFADASDFIFTFVGNIDMETILPYIEQYLASLPSLHRVEQADPSVIPTIRTGEYINRFTRPLETPKATVSNFYSGYMEYNLENLVTINMLKQILDLVYMEKVRKEESATYGVQTSARISVFPQGQTFVQAFFDTDPGKREEMNRIVQTELQRIATEGPQPEDFLKTQENMLKRHEEQTQENSYWLNILDTYYFRHIDNYTNYQATVKAATPKKIQKFVQDFLQQGNFIEVVMEPTNSL